MNFENLGEHRRVFGQALLPNAPRAAGSELHRAAEGSVCTAFTLLGVVSFSVDIKILPNGALIKC